MKHYIYGLVDPRAPLSIRFVGQCCDKRACLTRHVSSLVGDTSEWIGQLWADAEVYPQIVTIETTDDEQVYARLKFHYERLLPTGLLVNPVKATGYVKKPKPPPPTTEQILNAVQQCAGKLSLAATYLQYPYPKLLALYRAIPLPAVYTPPQRGPSTEYRAMSGIDRLTLILRNGPTPRDLLVKELMRGGLDGMTAMEFMGVLNHNRDKFRLNYAFKQLNLVELTPEYAASLTAPPTPQ